MVYQKLIQNQSEVCERFEAFGFIHKLGNFGKTIWANPPI